MTESDTDSNDQPDVDKNRKWQAKMDKAIMLGTLNRKITPKVDLQFKSAGVQKYQLTDQEMKKWREFIMPQ